VSGLTGDPTGSAPLRVLYVAGWGRSGSTLVSRVVGAATGFVWVGELKLLWERSLAEGGMCGCGAAFRECPFWEAVAAAAWGGFDGVDPAAADDFKRRYLRARAALPLVDRRTRSAIESDPAAREHLDALEGLYRAAAQHAGASVVVDSSASPSYADALAAHAGLDVRILHLVRDPRGVVYSWSKRDVLNPPVAGRPTQMATRYPPPATVFLWGLSNDGTDRLAARTGLPYLRVRYEDFVASPRATAARIVAFAGEPAADLPFSDERTVALPTVHSNAGNPMRFSTGDVPIVLDEEWRRALPRPTRTLTTVATVPLLRRYGYAVRA
jgi:hypothetical protein